MGSLVLLAGTIGKTGINSAPKTHDSKDKALIFAKKELEKKKKEG